MKIYKTNEAAIAIGVTPYTIRKYIKIGKLKATRKPKGLQVVYEIKESDIKQFCDEHGIEMNPINEVK